MVTQVLLYFGLAGAIVPAQVPDLEHRLPHLDISAFASLVRVEQPNRWIYAKVPASRRTSSYRSHMNIDELTSEAITIMKQLLNNPQTIGDSSILQLLFADQIVMGSPNKVHLTAMGGRMLAKIRRKEQSH